MLPTPDEFREICHMDDKGDPVAQNRLREVITEAPEFLNMMTDFVAVARRGVLDSFTGSFVTRTAVSAAIDNMVESLTNEAADDPVAKMYCQLVAVAWIHGMFCSTACAREPIDRTEAKFWTGQADRATRRYTRIMDSFERWRRDSRT